MRGLSSILSLFRNEFNKFNNEGARLKYLKLDFGVKTSRFFFILHTHYYNSNLIWRTVSRRLDEAIS